MANAVRLGQSLRGRAGLYTITKNIYEGLWLATNQAQKKVVVKSVNHFRLQNERDILLRFQSQTLYLRSLIDEIEDPPDVPALVLKYLDDDLLHASNSIRLTRPEIKYVAERVLKALQTLHSKGFVHTDIKPSNVLVNYGHGEFRFAEIQLADFGSTVHKDSAYAVEGNQIGTPIFRSPEAQLTMSWSTATDIWSVGTMLISLFYGRYFHIFKPDVPVDHEDYDMQIITNHYKLFGPWPASYEEIADQKRIMVMNWIIETVPSEALRPFRLTSTEEICTKDKEFLLQIMKLDPRDRPTAQQLLDDEWFQQD